MAEQAMKKCMKEMKRSLAEFGRLVKEMLEGILAHFKAFRQVI
jgi:hypothetical protein